MKEVSIYKLLGLLCTFILLPAYAWKFEPNKRCDENLSNKLCYRTNESGIHLAATIDQPLDLVELPKYMGDFYALYTSSNVVLALYYSTVKL
jgi:hypothetical protein